MNIVVNDAYLPYLKDNTRTQIFFGGSSSGKSFFLSQRTVLDVLAGRNYLIARNVGRTIRNSTYNQIVKAIIDMGLKKEFIIKNGDMTITCKRNNKQILFTGLDDVEKLKSITPIDGVLTDIWLEEATEVTYEAYKQLSKRLRGITAQNIPKRIIFSFNPVLRTHWICREFFGGWVDNKNLYRDSDLLILKTTYKDNLFLAEDDIKSLENEKDEYFYNVYTLGNWGVLGKVIYKNWRVEDLSEVKHRFDNIYNGLDFGWTNPSALVRVHVDIENKKIYVLDELYQSGKTIESLAEDVKAIVGNEYVTCDSEDPRMVFTLGTLGLRTIGAAKANTVVFGIKWLQSYEIIIDSSCQNFKNEIQQYHWDEDKNGNTLERPVKKNDHLLDALRYATESLQTRNKANVIDVRW